MKSMRWWWPHQNQIVLFLFSTFVYHFVWIRSFCSSYFDYLYFSLTQIKYERTQMHSVCLYCVSFEFCLSKVSPLVASILCFYFVPLPSPKRFFARRFDDKRKKDLNFFVISYKYSFTLNFLSLFSVRHSFKMHIRSPQCSTPCYDSSDIYDHIYIIFRIWTSCSCVFYVYQHWMAVCVCAMADCVCMHVWALIYTNGKEKCWWRFFFNGEQKSGVWIVKGEGFFCCIKLGVVYERCQRSGWMGVELIFGNKICAVLIALKLNS